MVTSTCPGNPTSPNILESSIIVLSIHDLCLRCLVQRNFNFLTEKWVNDPKNDEPAYDKREKHICRNFFHTQQFANSTANYTYSYN